jgi:hypothetical protein
MSVVKRRRKRGAPKAGELYQVVHGSNVVAEKTLPAEGAALSFTQGLLSKLGLGKKQQEDIDYVVRLKPVLGPPDDLYLVRLTPEGVILTASLR